MKQCYCTKCRKTMNEDKFYMLKEGERSDICKKCETMHLNIFDPDTFMWLMEKYDIPYIEAEWNVLRDRACAKDPKKISQTTVFGRYLAKMKLKQWRNFTYADTEMLKEEAEAKAKSAGAAREQLEEKIQNMKDAYENGEISEAQYKTYIDSEEIVKEMAKVEAEEAVAASPIRGFTKESFLKRGEVKEESKKEEVASSPLDNIPINPIELEDPGDSLTDEDKVYLAIKWGRFYSCADWVALEKHYKDYERSFSIHNADLERGLIQLSKIDLKMNQALDTGDYDAYTKLARSSDSLRKSLKFTEAQNKEEKVKEFDSVGAIVAFCEKESGYIPRYKVDAPKDIVDTILKDNQQYLQTLIHNEPNLSQQISEYLKKRSLLEEERAKRERGESEEDYELTDTDYADFYSSQDLMDREDIEIIEGEEF